MNYKVRRTALIDGDFIAYQLAAWAHSSQADSLAMSERIEETFGDWLQRSCCSDSLVMFSCSRDENFRRDSYPLYKAHRTAEPPAMLERAKEIVADCSRLVTIPHLEADDVMGILATNGKIPCPVIVTVDKDLRQIPGYHFNPNKEDFPSLVSVADADAMFYQQWLTGDATDGFGGIRGCGPKKAQKILDTNTGDGAPTPDDYELNICSAYEAAGYSRQECIAQARCARILRAEDFDAETRTPIPWGKHLEVR